jgi:hypothetical protein
MNSSELRQRLAQAEQAVLAAPATGWEVARRLVYDLYDQLKMARAEVAQLTEEAKVREHQITEQTRLHGELRREMESTRARDLSLVGKMAALEGEAAALRKKLQDSEAVFGVDVAELHRAEVILAVDRTSREYLVVHGEEVLKTIVARGEDKKTLIMEVRLDLSCQKEVDRFIALVDLVKGGPPGHQ